MPPIPNGMNVQERVPLAPLTTLGVGGEARFFVAAESVEDIQEALAFARAHTLPLYVLGGGSNIVIADSGFQGLVLVPRVRGITTKVQGDRTMVTVGAGVGWDEFVVWSIENNFAGLECLSGVPGTVGGAVVANLGAYGAQCSDTFVEAEVIDTKESDNTIQMVKKDACEFSYHDSMFGRTGGRYLIVRATFALSTNKAVQPSYRDNRFNLEALTEKIGRAPTQKDIREAVLAVREEKGNIIMEGRPSYKSAGSFFHMPFVSEEQYEQVRTLARSLDAEKEEQLRPWAWRQKDGSYKVAPGFLLEYTEFKKGFVRGGVGISPKHTLSIINVGGARARDIAELARDMQDAVEKLFAIRLEREVEYVGEVESYPHTRT